jgi:hypothetical protein
MICIVRTFGAPVMEAHGVGLHGGGHLKQGVVALYVKERGDADGATAGDAPQVVAHHVHDHHVLCLVLLGLAQPRRLGAVGVGVNAAWRRALHRPADHLASVQVEEEFGGGRADHVLAST